MAFIAVDLKALKNELIFLYMIDEIRRMVNETIIPLLKKKYYIHEENKTIEINKKNDITNEDFRNCLRQFSMKEYESFEDFNEMVFQFAYITLFAGVFPSASILSLFFNLIEFYSDSFKLRKKLYRRF